MPSLKELYDEYRELPPLPPEVDGKIASEPKDVAERRNALMREMIEAGRAEATGLILKYARHADVEREVAYQLHLLLVEKRVQEADGKVQNFPSLFKTALIRRLIDEHRSEHRHPQSNLSDFASVNGEGSQIRSGFDLAMTREGSPDQAADRNDTARQIAKAWWEGLRGRPQERRTYLVVHWGAETGAEAGAEGGPRPHKLREAAEILDVPLGTVKSRISHADALLDRVVQEKIRDREGELLYSPEELSELLRAIPLAIQEYADIRAKTGLMVTAGDSAPGRGR